MSCSILIVGGGGFIGQALAKRLCAKGVCVHVLTLSTLSFSLPNLHIHYGHLDDGSLLGKILPQCDIVIHLASATTPTDSDKGPVYEVENNLMPTMKLLEFIQRQKRIKKIIFISSGGAIYLPVPKTPIKETRVLSPKSFYGAGKIAIESFLSAFSVINQMNITILRPSNLYGPGQPFRPGFGLIRTMLNHIVTDRVMEIWGDGEVVRDYIYIDDIIDLVELMIHRPEICGTFNVGSCKGHSINQVIKIVEQTTETKLQIRYLPGRRVDIPKVIIDSSKLKKKIGWQPAIELETGILKTWNDLKN